jgi:transposase InsO family protein
MVFLNLNRTGRNAPEWVDGINRNQWTEWTGLGGRNGPEYAFIDDHSRLIPYGQFYTSENVRSFMHAFEQALLRRGLPRKLYVDNGSAYRSRQLMHTAASLGIALIHARPYKP